MSFTLLHSSNWKKGRGVREGGERWRGGGGEVERREEVERWREEVGYSYTVLQYTVEPL